MKISITNQSLFSKNINEKVGKGLFQNKFLEEDLTQLINGHKRAYDSSFFYTKNAGWVLIIHSDDLLIYGENWDQELLLEIKSFFDLTGYTNYLLKGNSELIYQMLSLYNITKYKIEKERIFYKTKKINISLIKNTSIRMATFEDINRLAPMMKQYYHEEYSGQNDKTLEESTNRVLNVVSSNNMYVLENANNEIFSFCTILNPDIGILFTNVESRNKGYGKMILSKCSNILLERNGEVFLMTDKDKIESNSLCKTLGYKEFFNYSYITINYS